MFFNFLPGKSWNKILFSSFTEYILRRKKRVNNHNNQIYGDDSIEQKLAIPSYKRKNINLDDDCDSDGRAKTLDFTEED